MSIPTTVDSFMNGALELEQPAPKHGYRVNVDSLWLVQFCLDIVCDQTHVIDFGAGIGIVGLALLAYKPCRKLTLVEQQPEIAEIAARNIVRCGHRDRADVATNDVLQWASNFSTTPPVLVVANPPFIPSSAGRQPLVAVRDKARRGDAFPFIAAIATVLARHHGKACLCYPPSHLLDAVEIAKKHNLFVSRIRFVHYDQSRPARLALVELACHAYDKVNMQPPWFDTSDLVLSDLAISHLPSDRA